MHRLLERQLRRLYGGLERVPPELAPLLAVVDQAYLQADEGRLLLERSLDLTSQELLERNRQLRRDLQEVARAKREREESLSLLQATLESTADGILVVDRGGRIVSSNRRFADMWKIPAEALAAGEDRSALESVLDQLVDPVGFLSKVEELYGEPEAESFDILEFRDGRVFERYSQPQRLDGECVGRVWSFRDVSGRHAAERDRLRLEEQLRQSQKLEALGRLAGGVAHDFNNLLTAILGYCELAAAQMRRDGRNYPEVAEIGRAGRRAADLTRQLLAFSRRQAFRPRHLRLNQVVSEMEQMLRRLIRADIELVTILEPDLHGVVADPGQVEQVITNLVVNACDAMPAGGRLTIATSNVAVDERLVRRYPALTPGDYVRLEVGDTGEGIAAAVRESIFEPFFTTKRVGEGTGLGLSVVYGLVEQSGGHILVESELGQGATFSVYLPRARAAAGGRAEEPAPAPVVRGGGETILLVEDEALVRKLASRILAGGGYRILEAAGGPEALEVATTFDGPIDLLLTDVVMPELPGPDLAAEVIRVRPGLKVLFMSGYNEQALGRDGGILSGAPLLHKPFGSSELLACVAEVLEPARRLAGSGDAEASGA